MLVGAAGEVGAGVLAYEEFKHRGAFAPVPEPLQGALAGTNTRASVNGCAATADTTVV
jgi:hypothetical protein